MDKNNRKMELVQSMKFFVGIDIAKKVHLVSFIDKNGIQTKVGIKINNSRESFLALETQLSALADKKEILIGMEPTGHYWKCLAWYLRNNGYQVVLVNPYHTNRSKEIRDNTKTKTDTKDSKLIAHLVREGCFLEPHLLTGVYADLREKTEFRESLVKDLSRAKIRLTALIDEFLPELCRCFADITCTTSTALLRLYQIKGLSTDSLTTEKIDLIVKTARGQISRAEATKSVNDLSQTIGVQEGVEGIEFRLKSIMEQIALFERQLKDVDDSLQKSLSQTKEASYLLTIKGMGVVLAATILGQTGSFDNYKNAKQLEKLAGYDLAEDSSGKKQGKKSFSKRGRDLLRHAFYRLALVAIVHNDEIKKLFYHKTNVLKKPKLVALSALIIKMVRVVFAVVKHKQSYDSNRILEGLSLVSEGR